MTEQDLKRIFESPFSEDNLKKVIAFVFPEISFFLKPLELPLDNEVRKKHAKSILQLGSGDLSDAEKLVLFNITLTESVRLDRNVKSIRKLIANEIIKGYQIGIGVFHNDDKTKWRFTLVIREFSASQTVVDKKPESYTYVFGEGEKGRTAAKRFFDLSKKTKKSLNDLEEAFSVEALSDDFFTRYKEVYKEFEADIVKNPSRLSLFKGPDREKAARDFVKRMMGRVIFLYFLQKRGWMGCQVKWKDGNEKFMKDFFDKAEENELFYHTYLRPLFFQVLAERREKVNEDCIINKKNFGKVPYLNGGLFEKDENHPEMLTLSHAIFKKFFDILESYNFTIIEDDPEYREVAVDPEMLGHIFENLLEDNKEKGAFYTPKEIVQYMCRESLLEYLTTKLSEKIEADNATLKSALRQFVMLHHFTPINDLDQQADEYIIQALKDVKVCDPAIGSGAFPMGILHEMFRLIEFFEDRDALYAIWNVEEWDAARFKESIIQNSIYGVDIEKGAVDIARLRFWLSIIIDEKEPRPLPNLDYKIVVGDSLLSKFDGHIVEIDWNIKVDKTLKSEIGVAVAKLAQRIKDGLQLIAKKQEEFFQTEVEDKDKLLAEIRNLKIELLLDQLKYNKGKYIDTHPLKGGFAPTPKEKKQNLERELAIKKFDDLQSSLQDLLKHPNKPFNHFDWRLDFPEVMNDRLIDKPGFDIIIGNPPYVQMQKDNGHLAEMLKDLEFETYERTGDLYAIFYEKGFGLLKENGIHTFITSSQWLRANYGKSLRAYFLKQNPQKLLLLGPGIFSSATVDTNILISKKATSERDLKGRVIKSSNELSYLTDSDLTPMPNVTVESWTIRNTTEESIGNKLAKFGKPLKDWKVEIYRGILTGLNEAFIIDKEKRKELIDEDPKCKPIIKPILRGRAIEKYYTDWNESYLIFIPWHFPLDNDPEIEGASKLAEKHFKNEFPSLYQYLYSHKEALSNRNKAETGIRYEWYALQRCAATYQDVFEKEKIVWKRIGSQLRFSYFDYEIYNLDSTCIATGEKIKYLTGLLNSKLVNYQLLETAQRTGMGDLLISVQALEPLLVHYPNKEEEKTIVSLVDKILADRKSGLDTSSLEAQIDALVYTFYDLTKEEIKLIDTTIGSLTS